MQTSIDGTEENMFNIQIKDKEKIIESITKKIKDMNERDIIQELANLKTEVLSKDKKNLNRWECKKLSNDLSIICHNIPQLASLVMKNEDLKKLLNLEEKENLSRFKRAYFNWDINLYMGGFALGLLLYAIVYSTLPTAFQKWVVSSAPAYIVLPFLLASTLAIFLVAFLASYLKSYYDNTPVTVKDHADAYDKQNSLNTFSIFPPGVQSRDDGQPTLNPNPMGIIN